MWLESIVTCGLALCATGAFSQTPSPAALNAERQEMEERYNRLDAAFKDLQASYVALQKRVAELETAVADLRAQMNKTPTNLATQEELKRLAEKLVELDQARKRDNELVLEKLRELGKTLVKAPPAPPAKETNAARRVESTQQKAEKGYEYVVEKGDTLLKIVKAYQDAGIKVTSKQVEEANPGVNWQRLQIGQKIFIPAPGQ